MIFVSHNPFRTNFLRRFKEQIDDVPGGCYSVYAGIRICACLLGCMFMKFGISMGGFPSLTQCTQFAKLGVFWEILSTKHPIWLKFGVFPAENGILKGPKIVLF